MTKEERYLLLRDSFARLPYGVKGINEYGNIITLKDWKTEQSIFDGIRYIINKYSWKPYLFPLSCMNEKQENEWNNLHFNPLYEVLEGKFNGKEEQLQLFSKSMADPIQWCYKNHFDCNGLIPLGLAIDCTNLNIY